MIYYHNTKQSSFCHRDSSDSSIYHHGILGMKWGIRRYQNEDGSLTLAGEERYRKLYKESISAGNYRKINKFHRKLADDANKRGTKATGAMALRRELNDEIDREEVNKLTVSEKYSKLIGPDRKKATLQAIENIDKIPDKDDSEFDKHAKKIVALTQDCIPFGSCNIDYANLYLNLDEKEIRKREKEAADLGLKTFNELGRHDYYNNDGKFEITPDDRFWFLYEDQTIGYGLVSDLINRGYTPKQVNKVLDTIEREYNALSSLNHVSPFNEQGLSGDTNDRNLSYANMVCFDVDDALMRKDNVFIETAYKIKNNK